MTLTVCRTSLTSEPHSWGLGEDETGSRRTLFCAWMILEMTAACLPVFCADTPRHLRVERSALPPIKLDELLGDIGNLQFQRGSRVVTFQHTQVCQGKKQGELVAGDKLPLGQ